MKEQHWADTLSQKANILGGWVKSKSKEAAITIKSEVSKEVLCQKKSKLFTQLGEILYNQHCSGKELEAPYKIITQLQEIEQEIKLLESARQSK